MSLSTPRPADRLRTAARRALAFVAWLALASAQVQAAPTGLLSTPTAPRFTVHDVEGRTLDLAGLLRHGPVLLDFWATWCAPCVQSLPELEAWHRRYGPLGLTVVGVSVDGPRNFARVRPFVASRGLTYPIVLDRDGRLQQSYQVLAVPTAILIDTTGAIVQVRVAYRPGEGAKLEDGIRALLPAAKAP
jgi:peroxiredoxin